jgi:hypothetical protein
MRRERRKRTLRELTVEGAGLRRLDELEDSMQGAPVLLQSELRWLFPPSRSPSHSF